MSVSAVARHRALLAGFCLLAAGAAAADEAPLPLLLPVPKSVDAGVRAQLATQRSLLSETYVRLKADADKLEARCTGVAEGTPKDLSCQAEAAPLEARRSDFASGANAYNSEVLAALNARVDQLTLTIRKDQGAIVNLGAGKNAGDYDDWVEMSADAEKERDEQCKEALREAGKAIVEAAGRKALDYGIQKIGSLNPPKANAVITKLRNAHINSPYIESRLRAIAYTAGKPEQAKDAKEIIDYLQKSSDVWKLDDLTDASDSKKWEAGATVLGLFVEDKRLELIGKLTLQEVRASFYSVNNNIVRQLAIGEVEDLTRLDELKLLDLKVLSAKLTNDVKAKRLAKSELADDQ